MTWFLVAAASVAAVLLFVHSPFKRLLSAFSRALQLSVSVIRNPAVSDHWKEKVLPAYALTIFKSSLGLFGCLLTLAAPFLVAHAVGLLIPVDVLATVATLPGILLSTLLALVTAWAWHELGSDVSRDYSIGQKILHHLVLGSQPLREFVFQIEVGKNPPPPGLREERHVFVSGLARAGTTVLMRSLYESGAFASLTYADMPFVLAPRFWQRLHGTVDKGELVERAHADGLMVDRHSPEALDEPFWLTFCRDRYLLKTRLVPHDVPADVASQFLRYLGAVVGARGKSRYLSKNNNYVLRMPGLLESLPNAVIVVPFREPGSQSASLLAQHLRFSDLQRKDPFTRRYMAWLGHFEFGAIHRPMYLIRKELGHSDPSRPDYWLEEWVDVYRYVLEVAERNPGIYPISYEALCESTETLWPALCELLDIEHPAPAFRRSKTAACSFADQGLVEEAAALYDRLQALSLRRFEEIGQQQTAPVSH